MNKYLLEDLAFKAEKLSGSHDHELQLFILINPGERFYIQLQFIFVTIIIILFKDIELSKSI